MLPLLPFMISLRVLQAISLAGKNKTTTTAANFYHDQPTFKVIPLKLFYYQTFFETWHNQHS